MASGRRYPGGADDLRPFAVVLVVVVWPRTHTLFVLYLFSSQVCQRVGM